jgi:hypothetical protein
VKDEEINKKRRKKKEEENMFKKNILFLSFPSFLLFSSQFLFLLFLLTKTFNGRGSTGVD